MPRGAPPGRQQRLRTAPRDLRISGPSAQHFNFPPSQGPFFIGPAPPREPTRADSSEGGLAPLSAQRSGGHVPWSFPSSKMLVHWAACQASDIFFTSPIHRVSDSSSCVRSVLRNAGEHLVSLIHLQQTRWTCLLAKLTCSTKDDLSRGTSVSLGFQAPGAPRRSSTQQTGSPGLSSVAETWDRNCVLTPDTRMPAS